MSTAASRSSRVTQGLLVLLCAGVWGLLLKPYLPSAQAAASEPRIETLDTLNVQRINILDPSGKTRLVIANGARFPDAVVNGKPMRRSIDNAAGAVFYDVNGQETGGLAFARLYGQDFTTLTFDYTYQPTDGLRMVKRESPDGSRWHAGFEILDRRPRGPGADESSQGIERVSLRDEDRDARLIISDVAGHPRIRIGVDPNGTPAIEMLDASGKVVYRAGQ
jgi:hypothetical protein